MLPPPAGQADQTGAAAGGGGRENAEESLQRGVTDEGAEPEGVAPGADIQVSVALTARRAWTTTESTTLCVAPC